MVAFSIKDYFMAEIASPSDGLGAVERSNLFIFWAMPVL